MKPLGRIAFKVTELLACIACVVTKVFTDLESRRVFILNQKLSREWGLLHNITWSTAGNSFANVTYGGYTLITGLMVISRCIDSRTRPTISEKILLTIGVILFFSMGGLVFAALDQVPSDLHDNAIILGCLSFFVGFLFIIDLADPLATSTTDSTQTELVSDGLGQSNEFHLAEKNDVNTIGLPIQTSTLNRNTTFNRNMMQNIDTIETSTLPKSQIPVFAKVFAGAEKVRPTRMEIPKSSYINKAHITHSYQENQGYQEDGIQTSNMNTYVRGSIIDNGNLIMNKPKTVDTMRTITTPTMRTKTTCCQGQQPIGRNSFRRDGYVANATKMWERRSRNSSFGMQTNV